MMLERMETKLMAMFAPTKDASPLVAVVEGVQTRGSVKEHTKLFWWA